MLACGMGCPLGEGTWVLMLLLVLGVLSNDLEQIRGR